jgi:hypothetical protein
MEIAPFMNSNPEIDPACRAENPRWVVTDEFAVCLTNHPLCPHLVVSSGYRLCFHPGRDQIISQTGAGSDGCGK